MKMVKLMLMNHLFTGYVCGSQKLLFFNLYIWKKPEFFFQSLLIVKMRYHGIFVMENVKKYTELAWKTKCFNIHKIVLFYDFLCNNWVAIVAGTHHVLGMHNTRSSAWYVGWRNTRASFWDMKWRKQALSSSEIRVYYELGMTLKGDWF